MSPSVTSLDFNYCRLTIKLIDFFTSSGYEPSEIRELVDIEVIILLGLSILQILGICNSSRDMELFGP